MSSAIGSSQVDKRIDGGEHHPCFVVGGAETADRKRDGGECITEVNVQISSLRLASLILF